LLNYQVLYSRRRGSRFLKTEKILKGDLDISY